MEVTRRRRRESDDHGHGGSDPEGTEHASGLRLRRLARSGEYSLTRWITPLVRSGAAAPIDRTGRISGAHSEGTRRSSRSAAPPSLRCDAGATGYLGPGGEDRRITVVDGKGLEEMGRCVSGAASLVLGPSQRVERRRMVWIYRQRPLAGGDRRAGVPAIERPLRLVGQSGHGIDLCPIVDPSDSARREFAGMMVMGEHLAGHFIIAGVLAARAPGFVLKQCLEYQPVLARAVVSGRHRPVGQNEVTNGLVEEKSAGADETAISLLVDPTPGTDRIPPVPADRPTGRPIDQPAV